VSRVEPHTTAASRRSRPAGCW